MSETIPPVEENPARRGHLAPLVVGKQAQDAEVAPRKLPELCKGL